MVIWKPPALKIVLVSLLIGGVILYILQFFFVLELARNLGLIISGIIIIAWDLLYKKSAGRKWDDGAVSTFFAIIPTFAVGALLILAMVISTFTSPSIDLSPAALTNYGLPFQLRNSVLDVADSGSRIISAEKANVEDREMWCVVTELDGNVDHWIVQEGRISQETLQSGFETYCNNWNVEKTP
jgi:hypothetical protein